MLKNVYLELLARKGYLVLTGKLHECYISNESAIAAILNSFNQLGYTINPDDLKVLAKLDFIALKEFYNVNFEMLKKLSGVSVKHKVFYDKFPMLSDISEIEYIIRALMHYFTANYNDDGFMNQDVEDFEREIIHNPKNCVLNLITEEEAKKYLVSLVIDLFSSKTPIAYAYNDFLKEMFVDFNEKIIINDIPFKENVAKYVNLLKHKNKRLGNSISKEDLRFVKTPTDLLRVYAIISNGDCTLRENTKFISLNRENRRLFISILNDMAKNEYSLIDDFARHEFSWKRAMEKLHVGEYKSKYPLAVKLCTKFRNKDYTTFYSRLEEAKNNQEKYISILMERPGEFARRLDYALRKSDFNSSYTLSSFKLIAYKLSSTLLLQLWEYFKNRDLYSTRIFKVNGRYDTFLKEVADQRANIPAAIIDEAICIIEEALSDKYAEYPVINNVYLDESVKLYCLPINSRNASAQNKTLTFGSRIKLDDTQGKFIRLFTHFRNMSPNNTPKDRVDVDLSVEFVNEDFTKCFSLAWHSMTGGKRFDSYHSGDIVSAPNGASEFIDLDYIAARKYARYAVVTNSVYTGQDFADIPECFSGVMLMNKLCKKGVIFNPEFIEHKFDLTQRGSNQNVAFAIDLQTLELIWIDCPLYYSFEGIVASASSGVIVALKNALKKHMSMYDFFKLHSKHISFIDDKEAAEMIISDSYDAALKPYDVEKISAEWL